MHRSPSCSIKRLWMDLVIASRLHICRHFDVITQRVKSIELKRLQRDSNSGHLFRGERDQIRIARMKLRNFRSVVTVAMSDEHNTPRPPAPLAQCRTVPPRKCPPQRISVIAATYPERTSALVLYGSYARRAWAPDHPFG